MFLSMTGGKREIVVKSKRALRRLVNDTYEWVDAWGDKHTDRFLDGDLLVASLVMLRPTLAASRRRDELFEQERLFYTIPGSQERREAWLEVMWTLAREGHLRP